MHVFKLELEYSDIFIYDLDLPNKTITYEVRDKDEGKLMEPRCQSKLQFTEDKILFDHRHITKPLAAYIVAILKDLINVNQEEK